MHDFDVWDIAVGKNYQIDPMLTYEGGEILLGIYWNAFWIFLACQTWWIEASFNVRNLCSSETDNIVTWIIPEIDIEIVKIPSSGSHYYDFLDHVPLPSVINLV